MYFGDYEMQKRGDTTRTIHYVSASSGLVAMVVKENGNFNYYYTATDHLGSITTVMNNPLIFTNSNDYSFETGNYSAYYFSSGGIKVDKEGYAYVTYQKGYSTYFEMNGQGYMPTLIKAGKAYVNLPEIFK